MRRPRDLRAHAVARDRLELRHPLDRHEAPLRLGHNGARDGVLAPRLDRRGEPEQFLLRAGDHLRRVVRLDDGLQVGDDGPALGQRARLVEGHDVDRGRFLEVNAALEEHAAPRRRRDGRKDRRRRADDQRAGRGHDHDGHRAVKHRLERVPQQQPRHENQQRGEDDHAQRVPALGVLQEPLRLRLLPLRFFHHGDEFGQRRFGRDPGHAHLEAALLVQRAGEERVAKLLLHRQRLARDRCLVHAALALHHDAIHRNALTRPHQHAVVDGQLVDLHHHRPRAAFAERSLGPELHQRGNGRAAFLDRHFLQRVREREKEEQHRALERVVDVGRAERREDHQQIDVHLAAKHRAHAVDRAMPTAREVGREVKPRLQRDRQADRRTPPTEQHEHQRGHNAQQLRVAPVDRGQPARLRRARLPRRHLAIDRVRRDCARRVGEQRLGQRDWQ